MTPLDLLGVWLWGSQRMVLILTLCGVHYSTGHKDAVLHCRRYAGSIDIVWKLYTHYTELCERGS